MPSISLHLITLNNGCLPQGYGIHLEVRSSFPKGIMLIANLPKASYRGMPIKPIWCIYKFRLVSIKDIKLKHWGKRFTILTMRMALLNKSYKFPNQLQHDTMQCGVACLEMICKYYKKIFCKLFTLFFATVYDSDWNEPHSPANVWMPTTYCVVGKHRSCWRPAPCNILPGMGSACKWRCAVPAELI